MIMATDASADPTKDLTECEKCGGVCQRKT